jgi:hypothetical protein
MPKPKPFARIAITLPEEDLRAADALAAALDRSRSWVLAESLRRFVQAHGPAPLDALGASRRHQLRRDLATPPEERVSALDDFVLSVGPRAEHGIVAPLRFTSYEEYEAWRKARAPAQ